MKHSLLFLLALVLLALPASAQALINEVDADQTGTDDAEFVELYDGGVGNTDLTGLVLVFFNGSDDASYEAFDLDGFSTDADGYFVLCGDAANVPNCDLDVSPNTNLIQNGEDAVALFTGDATDFPEDTPVTTTNLIDAIVYETNDDTDAGLTVLLNGGQSVVDENSLGTKDTDSLQRIPNGDGGARNTDTYQPLPPTPGAVNMAPLPPIVINEIDADQTSTDDGEFVELYDGGVGNFDLTGLVLVFFNGSDDASYDPAFDLDGFSTNADGFFVVCGDAANVPNCDLEVGPGTTNLIQNGEDAVAVFLGDATDFPNDTPVTTTNLVDAVVYETNDDTDSGLLVLLEAGQMPVDENSAGTKDTESIQRSPDGAGGPRVTSDFIVAAPTPGATNALGGGGTGDGSGTATLANQSGSPLDGTDIFRRVSAAQTVEVTLTGEAGSDALTDVTLTVPADFTGLDAMNVTLSGTGFAAAAVAVNGQDVEITGADVTDAQPGTVTIGGLTTPDPAALTDDGLFAFDLATAIAAGTLTPIADAPTAFVTIPVANIRDVDVNGVPLDLNDIVAVEGVATVGSGTFDNNNLLAYIQDETAGTALFNFSIDPTITVGNRYAVKGSVIQFSGLTESDPGVIENVVDLGPDVSPAPQVVTIAQILADAEALEGSLLQIDNADLTGGTWPASGSTTLTISDDGGTTELSLRIDSDTNIDGSPEPSFPLSVVGVLGQFDSSSPFLDGYQIQPRSTADFIGETVVNFAQGGATVSETEGFVTYEVIIASPDPLNDTTVEVFFTGGTATNGQDFNFFPFTTLTFPAGDDTPQSFTLALTDDMFDEGTEIAQFALINAMGGNNASTGNQKGFKLTIVDDDAVAPAVVINELDADQTDTDVAEFVELYDGGMGNTALDNLVLVFFNGNGDQAYEAFSLDGLSTNADGFFVLCGDAANVPNCDLDVDPNDNLIQNGADAVALYIGSVDAFADGAPVSTTGLIDAIVYDTNDDDDAGLLVLLEPGEAQLNEDENGTKDTTSLQRFPDGEGGPRITAFYGYGLPTPGAMNALLTDGGGDGGTDDAEGTATLANRSGGLLDGTDIFRRGDTAQTAEVTVAGAVMGMVLTEVTVTVPDAFTGFDAANVTLSGDGFTGAAMTVDGQTVSVTGAAVTDTATGTFTIAGLTAPTPTAVDDDGVQAFTVGTGIGTGPVAIAASPNAYVTIPIASIRDVDANGNPADAGETVAVEGVATVGSGMFDADNLLAYIQDETAGTALFDFSLNPTITVGNRYVVKGSVDFFSGLTEIGPDDDAAVIDFGADTPVVPREVTIAEILADAEALEGSLLSILSVDLVDGTWPGEGSSTNLTVTDDGGATELEVRIDSDTDIDGSPEPLFPIMVTGVLGQFDSSTPFDEGYQLLPRSLADIGAGVTETRVQFAQSTMTVAENAGAVAIEVTILNPDPATDTTVEVALTGGTATEGSDYAAFATTTLTFAAGSADSQTATVTLVDDAEMEDTETLVFTLQNAAGGDMAAIGTRDTFTLTVADDDAEVAAGLLINELDADQTSIDLAEFVELYDGGVGNTDLTGLVLVFFNGSDDASYAAWDLDGFSTDENGFFVICGNAANVPNCDYEPVPGADNWLQNGADAVALIAGDADLFPEDTPVTTANVIDAVVYDTNDDDDEGLSILLNAGQLQLNEDAGGAKDTESLQRLPDGSGGARNTDTFTTALPTPGLPNGGSLDTQVQFEVDATTVSEADGTVTVNVTLRTPDPANDTTVEVALGGDGTATAGTDFDAFATTTLTFAAGSDAPQSVTIGVIDDGEAEDDETVVLVLQNATGGTNATVGSPNTFTLTILDDDADLSVTLAEARALGVGARVTVEGIITRAMGDFARMQDETGGLTLRDVTGPLGTAIKDGTVAQGDLLRITGTLSEFAALLELNEGDIESFEVISRDNPLPAAVPLTLAEIVAGGEQYEGMLVYVANLTIDTPDAVFAAATTYDITDGTTAIGDIGLRTPNTDDTAIDGTPVPNGLVFDFEGVLGQFSFGDALVGYQIHPVLPSDIIPFIIDAVDEDTTLPVAFALEGNYPNPFNPATTLRFDLPAAAQVTVEVYDVMGRRVMALPAQSFSAGRSHTVSLDASNLSSGLYLYRLIARSGATTEVGTGSMTLLK